MNEVHFYFYQVVMIASLVVSPVIAFLVWRHRRANGGKALLALAGATFVWTLGFFLEAHSTTLDRQLLFNNIGYLRFTFSTSGAFVFSFNYTSGDKVIRVEVYSILYCSFHCRDTGLDQ